MNSGDETAVPAAKLPSVPQGPLTSNDINEASDEAWEEVSASTRWNLAELILIWKQYNVQCKGSND
jgi:hypothetical protein